MAKYVVSGHSDGGVKVFSVDDDTAVNISEIDIDEIHFRENTMNKKLTTINQNSKAALVKAKSLLDMTNRLISRKVAEEEFIPRDVWLDPETKLMWQDDEAAATVMKPWVTENNYYVKNYMNTSGDTAATYASNLTFWGYNDWRLPTKDELKDLYEKKDKLKNVNSSNYWCSTVNNRHKHYAWGVCFDVGDVNYYYKFADFYVRCVRNENPYLKNSLAETKIDEYISTSNVPIIDIDEIPF